MLPVRTFRDDINGLRAWAVIAVILFHFGIPGFDGGFVGVDIFFVISGFLMTSIIIRALEKTAPDRSYSFSLIDFYLSRGQRIIPALLVLCMALLAAAWFFLPAHELRTLGSHSTAALGFLSNFKFWLEAGYFDVASHEKWLLHTWSLSVEWQFYVILPIILLLVWKLLPGRKAAIAVVAVMLLSSLTASIITSGSSPSTAFYMLHTRAWEMLAGGLVFLLGDGLNLSERIRRWFYFAGFGLIIFSVAMFDAVTVWPGANALVPVVGTVLVLIAAKQKALLTGHTFMQRLGDWSYSLYLWHWPFSVALVYIGLQANYPAILLCLILTLVLGWVSYRFVERPARKKSAQWPKLNAIGALGSATLVAGLTGAGIYLKDGVPGRLPLEVEAVFAESANKNPRMVECHIVGGMDVPGCTYGGELLGAIVIGDSHAASVVRSVEKALPSVDLHVLDWTLNTCQTMFGLKRTDDASYRCADFLSKASEDQKQFDPQVPLIVVNRLAGLFYGSNELPPILLNTPPEKYISLPHATRDDRYRGELRSAFVDTMCTFAKSRPVYILGPIPELIQDVPKTMARAMQFTNPLRVSIPLADYYQRQRFVLDTIEEAVNQCGAIALDPVPYLCSDDRCWGDTDGLPVYYDDDHLNERGGELLVPMFQSIFNGTKQTANLH